MPLIIDRKVDEIGYNTWWKQNDGKIFVVARFLGFDFAERVEIIPIYSNKTIEVDIDKFLKLIHDKKITNITKNE